MNGWWRWYHWIGNRPLNSPRYQVRFDAMMWWNVYLKNYLSFTTQSWSHTHDQSPYSPQTTRLPSRLWSVLNMNSKRRFFHLPITYAEFLVVDLLSGNRVINTVFFTRLHRNMTNCGCRRHSRMPRPKDYELLRLRAITADHTRLRKGTHQNTSMWDILTLSHAYFLKFSL